MSPGGPAEREACGHKGWNLRPARDTCDPFFLRYDYFGVQYGGSGCFCGNSYGSQGSAPLNACNMTCAGVPTLPCGGANLNSVYRTVSS